MAMRCVGLVAVVAVAAVAGWLLSGGEQAQVGNQAPRFSLTAQDGSVVSSNSLKGQVVLLNFWSTTCGSCVRELPHLQHVEEARWAKVVAVAVDPEGWTTVRPFIGDPRHAVTFTVVVGTEDLMERFDVQTLPHSVLLDREQRVVKVYRGPVTKERLEKDIAAINTRG